MAGLHSEPKHSRTIARTWNTETIQAVDSILLGKAETHGNPAILFDVHFMRSRVFVESPRACNGYVWSMPHATGFF